MPLDLSGGKVHNTTLHFASIPAAQNRASNKIKMSEDLLLIHSKTCTVGSCDMNQIVWAQIHIHWRCKLKKFERKIQTADKWVKMFEPNIQTVEVWVNIFKLKFLQWNCKFNELSQLSANCLQYKLYCQIKNAADQHSELFESKVQLIYPSHKFSYLKSRLQNWAVYIFDAWVKLFEAQVLACVYC